jgi:hypothetical protein
LVRLAAAGLEIHIVFPVHQMACVLKARMGGTQITPRSSSQIVCLLDIYNHVIFPLGFHDGSELRFEAGIRTGLDSITCHKETLEEQAQHRQRASNDPDTAFYPRPEQNITLAVEIERVYVRDSDDARNRGSESRGI